MIVKKWRNVKDNFNKYLKKLKESSKSGSAAIALKKYHYYHQLLFLMKVQQNATDSSLDLEKSALNDTPESENNPVPHSSRYVPANRKRIMPMNDFEKETLKALNEPDMDIFQRAILPLAQIHTHLKHLKPLKKVGIKRSLILQIFNFLTVTKIKINVNSFFHYSPQSNT